MTSISLSLLFGSPWIAALAYLWPRARRTGALDPSAATSARERLWA